jgi:ATP-binding protein involved in chromosome partitioning
VIENMSAFVCPHCGNRSEIFKHGGGRSTAEQLGVPFLGDIPIDPEIVIGGDAGTPIVVSHPDSAAAGAFVALAAAIRRQLERT